MNKKNMVKVDKNTCIGCGLCANLCPDVFKIDSDGKSTVVGQKNVDCARQAAATCPVSAITVE